MRIGLRAIAVAFGVSLMASPTLAHHSMGTYDQSTMKAVKGTVSHIEWRNPHARITLTVNNADGTTGTQQIEIAGPAGLTQKGFAKDLLNIGDSVTIESWMPKDSRYGNVPSGRILTLADGRRFDVGDNWLQAQPPENQPR